MYTEVVSCQLSVVSSEFYGEPWMRDVKRKRTTIDVVLFLFILFNTYGLLSIIVYIFSLHHFFVFHPAKYMAGRMMRVMKVAKLSPKMIDHERGPQKATESPPK